MIDTITINERLYTVEIESDYDQTAPWDNEDGHGPVTGWTRNSKAPGEMVLNEDRGSKRYYDFAEACRIAKRDGWSTAAIEARKANGERVTAKEQASAAATANFERLRGWSNGDWQYVAVIVTDDETGESESLGGIESDCGDYLAEVAQELAEELNAQWEASRQKACLLAYEG